jgi:hypothetical protein
LLNGVDDFISKPFKAKDFVGINSNKIRAFLIELKTIKIIYILERKYFLHEINTSINGIKGFVGLPIDMW